MRQSGRRGGPCWYLTFGVRTTELSGDLIGSDRPSEAAILGPAARNFAGQKIRVQFGVVSEPFPFLGLQTLHHVVSRLADALVDLDRLHRSDNRVVFPLHAVRVAFVNAVQRLPARGDGSLQPIGVLLVEAVPVFQRGLSFGIYG